MFWLTVPVDVLGTGPFLDGSETRRESALPFNTLWVGEGLVSAKRRFLATPTTIGDWNLKIFLNAFLLKICINIHLKRI